MPAGSVAPSPSPGNKIGMAIGRRGRREGRPSLPSARVSRIEQKLADQQIPGNAEWPASATSSSPGFKIGDVRLDAGQGDEKAYGRPTCKEAGDSERRRCGLPAIPAMPNGLAAACDGQTRQGSVDILRKQDKLADAACRLSKNL